jgi:ribonuclease-3
MEFQHAIKEIEAIIGYHFQDASLLRQAFTRKSYCNEARQAGKGQIQSNEVLEFCGDSVLSAAIISILMEKCSGRAAYGLSTELDEGSFTVIKSNLTNKTMLSKKIGELGLEKYLLVGRGDASRGIISQPSVMEDLFESIIGAVYFDCGKDMRVMIELIGRLLDTEEYLKKNAVRQAASPYNALQEYCQAKKLPFSFAEIEHFGPEHERTYVFACYVQEKEIARGQGGSGAKAKAAAAAAALPLLVKKYGE